MAKESTIPHQKMIVLGLTGGIGSGKTTIAGFFKALGVPIYIADEAAKRLMNKNPLKDDIRRLFGSASYKNSGQLNRQYLASRVFNNPAKLAQLNQLVHPRVREDFKSWMKQQTAKYVLYEAAILFETRSDKPIYDYSVLVVAPKEERIKRLKKRDQTSRKKIEARMKNQWSDERKRKLADWVIENTDLKAARSEIIKIHSFFSNL